MTSIPELRRAAVDTAVDRIRAIESSQGVTRASLALIRQELLDLAAKEYLFPLDEFPHPPPGECEGKLYPLSGDANGRFTLYMNSLNPGKYTPPHNHTTWAVVVAIEGTELNTIYRRIDDGGRPGYAQLVVDHEVMVQPGQGVALMPDDIHSIELTGAAPTRHLHMYGIALDRLEERIAFDLETGRTQLFNEARRLGTLPNRPPAKELAGG